MCKIVVWLSYQNRHMTAIKYMRQINVWLTCVIYKLSVDNTLQTFFCYTKFTAMCCLRTSVNEFHYCLFYGEYNIETIQACRATLQQFAFHDDVIKWKHFSGYWSFVRGIHRSPMDSPHKGHCGALMFSLICAWTNGWANNRDAGDLKRYRAHYDVIVM